MKRHLKLYVREEDNRLSAVGLVLDEVEHCTADVRQEGASINGIVTVCTSRSTMARLDRSLDAVMKHMLEEGLVKVIEIEATQIEMSGDIETILHTTFIHQKFKELDITL